MPTTKKPPARGAACSSAAICSGRTTTSWFETYALVQARLGTRAVQAVESVIEPLLDVQFVDQRLHREAVTALRAPDRRAVSLVDWTSFLFMRRAAMTRAFAFDAGYAREGFGSPLAIG